MIRAARSPWPALAVALLLAGFAPVAGQSLDDARAAWQGGEYADAVRAYETLAGESAAAPEVHRERVRLLLEIGRYAEAEEAALEAGGTPATARALGQAQYALGRVDEAEASFREAIRAGATDAAVARRDLAVLLWRKGERDEALPLFDSFIDLYNDARDALTAEEMVAVGDAVRYLAITESVLFEDALLAYDRAAERAPSDPLPKIRAGELFLEKYQAPDAHTSFDEALELSPAHPRALLGKARVFDFDGDAAAAMEWVRNALEVSPDHVEARTFLARMHLSLEEYDEALSEVERALEQNPSSLDALSVLAAVHYLQGDVAAYGRVRDRALALNPRWADLYNTVASLAVDHRQYHAAVELAEQAVALDSLSWWGWGILGVNQLRIGLIEEGTANVERAFEGDPHNVWLFNTLTLTDTFERFRTSRTEHFELFLHGEEADLLEPYVARVAEEAYDALLARYGVEPPLPIRLELFTNHGDFSVRTLGLVGLGALGVSFGSVLVMDSPAARPAGEFNWQSTLWHELAHAFHLAMTDHHVPRWFSEGLAVHEQRLARPYWGFSAGPGFLQAYEAGRLHPVSMLNHGFVRPDYPEQVLYSYLQASLVFEMLEERQGLGVILDMMRGYRDGRSTEELVGDVLGMSAAELDREFDRYFRERYAVPLRAVSASSEPVPPDLALPELQTLVARRPDDFRARVALGTRLYDEGRLDEAVTELRRAAGMFPDYVGPGTPYVLLAQIHREREAYGQAIGALQEITSREETAFQVHMMEAEIHRELENAPAEAAALERAVEIFPYDIEVHRRLAELESGLGDFESAVLEREAILALDPPDLAGAHYELALAHFQAGDRENARDHVLRALEIAPSFAEAQDLLLQLRGEP